MTEGNSERTKTLERIDEEWRLLLDSAGHFTAEEQLLPNAVGDWTIKDLLGHIATWDDETVSNMERFLQTGERLSYEAVDQWNNAAAEGKRWLTAEQTWQDLQENHQRLIDYLNGVAEELLSTGRYSQSQVLGETAVHYREHREDLERWQEAHNKPAP